MGLSVGWLGPRRLAALRLVTDPQALDGTPSSSGGGGILLVLRVSELATDEDGKVLDLVEIVSMTLSDKPLLASPPCSTESMEELKRCRAVLVIRFGEITVALFPESAGNEGCRASS